MKKRTNRADLGWLMPCKTCLVWSWLSWCGADCLVWSWLSCVELTVLCGADCHVWSWLSRWSWLSCVELTVLYGADCHVWSWLSCMGLTVLYGADCQDGADCLVWSWLSCIEVTLLYRADFYRATVPQIKPFAVFLCISQPFHEKFKFSWVFCGSIANLITVCVYDWPAETEVMVSQLCLMCGST